jgi:uncharacterized membrane protein YhhN
MTTLPNTYWPDGKRCAVLISVLFNDGRDAVAQAPDLPQRSKSFSVWQYGALRGVDRLLQTFADFTIPASWFVPGLVAFLVAHLCYFKLLSMDAPLLSSRRSLVCFSLAGGLMYAVLFFNGLPVEMRIPVGLYVMVIALMASQAWGRSLHLEDLSSWRTAVGASVFMLSGGVLAIDRFINPLPYAGLWVLATYYVAQALMVTGLLRSLRQQAELQKKPVSQFNQFRNS